MSAVSKAMLAAMRGMPQVESDPVVLPEKDTTAEYHAHCTERCEHHRQMAQKAGSPASRALHRKLQAHFTNKLKAK